MYGPDGIRDNERDQMMPARNTKDVATKAHKRRSNQIGNVLPMPRQVDANVAEYAQCRSLGHSWNHVAPDMGQAEYGSYGFRSQCDDCGTVRTKWIARSGAYRPAKYEYPAEYARRGEDRLSTTEWRRALIVSMIGDD